MSETRVIPRAELSQRTKDRMQDKRRIETHEYIEYRKALAEKHRKRRHIKS